MTHPYLAQLTGVIGDYGVGGTARLVARELQYLTVTRLVRRSYSQTGEDRLAWDLLGRPPHGLFVDIGANDPVRLSNTYLLYRRGWRGLAVDASPVHRQRWARLRPDDEFVVSGVGSRPSAAEPFHVHRANALSTFSRDRSDRAVADGHPRTAVVDVPVRTLADLLDQHVGERAIDFMTVDVEGRDLDVLESNDWDRYRPRLICTEVDRADADEIDAFLRARGYRIAAARGANAFYVSAGTRTGRA